MQIKAFFAKKTFEITFYNRLLLKKYKEYSIILKKRCSTGHSFGSTEDYCFSNFPKKEQQNAAAHQVRRLIFIL